MTFITSHHIYSLHQIPCLLSKSKTTQLIKRKKNLRNVQKLQSLSWISSFPNHVLIDTFTSVWLSVKESNVCLKKRQSKISMKSNSLSAHNSIFLLWSNAIIDLSAPKRNWKLFLLCQKLGCHPIQVFINNAAQYPIQHVCLFYLPYLHTN